MRNIITLHTFSILLFVIFCVGMFGIYAATAFKEPTHYADSDDLILASYFGTTAHPPGYPLLTLLLNPLFHYLDASELVYSANLINGGLTTLTLASLGILFYFWQMTLGTRKEQVQLSLSGILFSLISFGLSAMTWRHATIFEVFPLSQLLLVWFGIAMFWVLKKTPAIQWYAIGLLGAVAGLNVFYHQLSLPLIAIGLGCVGRVLWRNKAYRQINWLLGSSLFSFVLLFGLYYLTNQKTLYGWGVGYGIWQNIAFFLRLPLRGGGSAIEQAVGQFNLLASIQSVYIYAQLILAHFGWPLVFIIVLGMFKLWQSDRVRGRLISFLLLIYGPGMVFYLKFPLQTTSMVDTHYYWGTVLLERMLFIHELLLVIPLWYGFSMLLRWWRNEPLKHVLMLCGLGFIVFLSVLRGYQALYLSFKTRPSDYAKQVLTTLPEQAVLMADSDMVFAFLYWQQIRQIRSDITIVPVTTVMRDYWFEKNSHLYTEMHSNRLDQAYDSIATQLKTGKLVLVYDADPRLLTKLQEDGYYIIPHGWTLEITNQPKQGDWVEVEKVVASVVEANASLVPKLGTLSFWYQGLYAHEAGQLAMQGYYLNLFGEANGAERLGRYALSQVYLPATRRAIKQSVGMF